MASDSKQHQFDALFAELPIIVRVHLSWASREDVEDAALRAFGKLWEKWGSVDEAGRRAYVYRATWNELATQHKARRKRPALLSLDEPLPDGEGYRLHPRIEAIAHPDAPAPELLEARELAQQVRHALAALPEAYRAPLVLQYEHGLSMLQIGDALQLNENTVRSRNRRGRDKLAAPLGRYLFGKAEIRPMS